MNLAIVVLQKDGQNCNRIRKRYLEWTSHDQNNNNSIPENDVYFRRTSWITVKDKVRNYEEKLEILAKR